VYKSYLAEKCSFKNLRYFSSSFLLLLLVSFGLSSLNFGNPKFANAVPVSSWNVELSGLINNTSLNQVVCVSSTNCIAWGQLSSNESSLFNSTDGVSIWTQVSKTAAQSGPTVGSGLVISCPSTSTCYASLPGASGLYESTNSGSTWTSSFQHCSF
jgi:hypothetical protein